MNLSIRWRLAVVIAAAMIITLVAMFIALGLALENILRSDLDESLQSDSDQVLARVTVSGAVSEEALQAIADSYAGDTLRSSFVVVFRTEEGDVIGATGGINAAPFALSEEDLARVLRGGTVTKTVHVDGEGDLRIRSVRLSAGGEVAGVAQVGQSAEFINSTVRDIQRVLVIVAVAGVLAAIAIGYWLARSAVQPLQRVAAVAAEIEASDLSRRIGAERAPAEVQQLADTFDGMLDRLERAFGQQRDFVMDMSHEIRTPLTALRGNIDVLLLDDSLDADAREQLERMSGEVQRLVRLTSNLLYSAHAEAGREVARQSVDLDALCLEVARQARPLRPEVALRMGEEDQVTVVGDRDLLKQLVLNLVDNALKYTPEGGTVTLSLRKEGEMAKVVVEDNGPGIPPEQLPHIFERMYRAENGRRRTSGAGLGLAISRWIASAHGGTIEVESEVGKGSKFTLTLPNERGVTEAVREPS
jgi:heavy metal sensor kinase